MPRISIRRTLLRGVYLAVLTGAAATPVAADNNAGSTPDANSLRQELQTLEQSHERQRQALEQRIQALEARQRAAKASGGDNWQMGLSALFAAGGSSVDNAALLDLQGGAHDPNQNGFTVQNVELSIQGTVDPYLDAQASVIFQIDAEGETVVELEEAFFTTRSLPWGLQIKAGQYFTEFGRHNVQHPHAWGFVDQPVVLSRLFGGDGLRSQGLRVSWLLPTDWYSELYFGAQNPRGETVVSFLSAPEESIGGHVLTERSARGSGDLLYSARWLSGLDVSETTSVNAGVSALWGPNASGSQASTEIYGADLYLKWQPLQSVRGFPFVAWHSEALWRRYEAGEASAADYEVLRDRGWFSQVVWGFRPRWAAGLRWDYAKAEGPTADDPLRDTRERLAGNLTWWPTEYTRLRLQYNRDWTEHLPEETADSVWLQVEFNLGAHAAHTF